MKKTKKKSNESLSKGYVRAIWADWRLNFHDDEDGIDGNVMVCQEETSNYELSFGFQLKSTQELKIKEDKNFISFPYDSKHLKSFLNYGLSFLFIVYDCKNNQAYWINLHDDFKELDKLEKQKYISLKIPKNNLISDKDKIIKNLKKVIPPIWIRKSNVEMMEIYERNPKIIPSEEFKRLLEMVKRTAKNYNLKINLDLEISKNNFYGDILLYLLREYVSPIELKKFWNSTSGEEWWGIYVGDQKKDKVFLPLGDIKLRDTLLDLIKYNYIEIIESHPIVWSLDGWILQQPPGARLQGKSIEGKVIAFVLNLTEKGRNKLIELYGTEENAHDEYIQKYIHSQFK